MKNKNMYQKVKRGSEMFVFTIWSERRHYYVQWFNDGDIYIFFISTYIFSPFWE